MAKSTLLVLFNGVPLLDHHLQKYKSTPSSTQITSWSKKKQRIKVCTQGYNDYFHLMFQNTRKFIIVLEINLYSLFFYIPAGDLGGGGCTFEFLKVVVQPRHSISLNSTNKVLFTM